MSYNQIKLTKTPKNIRIKRQFFTNIKTMWFFPKQSVGAEGTTRGVQSTTKEIKLLNLLQNTEK